MKEFSDVLGSIAAILWPVFAFVALYIFKDEIRSLLGRMQKGKFLGQEFELEKSVKELEVKAEGAAAAIPSSLDLSTLTLDSSKADITQRILSDAVRSPKAALLLLSSELERAVRELLASTGWHTDERVSGFQQGLDALVKRGAIPATIAGSAKAFRDVRNKLVHGYASNDDVVLSAIDSGLTILRAVQAIPHETHVVHDANITIYEDHECKTPRNNIKGLILESTSPGGVKNFKRMFPTTCKDYQKGRKVAWEWNMGLVVPKSWYRDPDTKELKIAWEGSGEFVGNHIDDTV